MTGEVVKLGGIKLTYGDINNNDMSQAMNKLDACTAFNAKTLFDFNKLKSKWDKEAKRAQDLFNKLVDKHAEKDEKGKAKRDTQTMKFKFADEAAFNKDVEELLTQSFEVRCTPFKTSDLLSAKLAPKDIRALAPILSDYKDEE